MVWEHIAFVIDLRINILTSKIPTHPIMEKLVIDLRQDTPMWHFRPDEKGCCLRASEVKPKLDKFLTDKLDSDVEDEWKLKNQGDEKSIHLDYKMTFESIGEYTEIKGAFNKNKGIYAPFPLFFGNMGEGEKKKLIYYPDGIRMTIFSLHKDLVEKIDMYICEFFACHSFGTRQSKGFGCFYPEKINEENISEKLQCDNIIKTLAQYKFEVNIKSNNEQFLELFRGIDSFHKKIRSGINLRNFYFKSLMFSYAKEKNSNWDKPQIRHFFGLIDDNSYFKKQYEKKCGQRDNKDGKKQVKQSDENCPRESMIEDYNTFGNSQPYKFTKDKDGYIPLFRDALGLSGTQSWLYYNAEVNITDSQTDKNKKVTRFKTPFLYRPVENSNGSYTIYIIFDKDYREKLDKLKEVKFKIEANKIVNKNKEPINGCLKAKIYQDFDLIEYFNYIFSSKKLKLNLIKLQQP